MIFKNMTLILPTYNEENRIERVLNYYIDKSNILVVDNYSSDKTIEIINNYNDYLIVIKFNLFDKNIYFIFFSYIFIL